MKKRSNILILVFSVVIMLALAACGGGEANKGPIVKLEVGDQVIQADPYFYCWPQSADDTLCDLNEAIRVQPATADVTADTEVRFVIEGIDQPPSSFKATLLDDPGDVQTFGTDTAAVYNTEYEDGFYRVQVDVEYADVDGQPASVSYVYGLNIEGVVVVVVPTATPTSPPTETPTVTPTPTNTVPPTETPVPTSTNTPTPASTDTPLPEPTDTPAPAANDTPVPADTDVPEPTVDNEMEAEGGTEDETPEATNTPTPVGDVGTRAITGTVQTTEDGELVPVEGVTVSYQHTSPTFPNRNSTGTTQTDVEGQFSFDPILLHDTDSVSVSVETPGYLTASELRSGLETWNTAAEFDFVLVPTSGGGSPIAPPPTFTPSVRIAEELTQPLPEEVPPLTLNLAGRDYTPVGYQYCNRVPSGERACIEFPAQAATTRRLTLPRGAAAQLHINYDRPQQVRIEYRSDTGLPTGEPEVQPGDNLVLFVIMPEPGSYILAIHATWETEEATYYFRVEVIG